MDQVIFGNRLDLWIFTLGGGALLFLVLLFVRKALRSSTRIEALAKIGQVKTWFLIVVAVSVASRWLELSPLAAKNLDRILTFSLIFQVALIADSFVTAERIARMRGNSVNPVALNLLMLILKTLLWVTVLLLCLDNLGVQITALIAGLGVGGIAIALAVQNILGDLFGSLTIALDKPFEVGDAIALDSFSGTVERVGIKTTRIRSVTGEELVFSNGDLLKSRIRNFRRMRERRVVLKFGLVYETSPEKLERANELVRHAIEKSPQVRFDRCHLSGLGAYSLDFEAIYWMKTPEYAVFMDAQQAILLEILKSFAAEGLDFAYPTQVTRSIGGESNPG